MIGSREDHQAILHVKIRFFVFTGFVLFFFHLSILFRRHLALCHKLSASRVNNHTYIRLWYCTIRYYCSNENHCRHCYFNLVGCLPAGKGRHRTKKLRGKQPGTPVCRRLSHPYYWNCPNGRSYVSFSGSYRGLSLPACSEGA